MVATFKGKQSDGGTGERGTAVLPATISHPAQSFQDLLHQTQRALAAPADPPEILSFCFECPAVDLLTLWEMLPHQQTPYAYWEQPHSSLRILAMGQVVSIQASGSQRFQQVQRELQRWQRSLLMISHSHAPATTPPWLASFTFFDELSPESPAPFSPAWVWLPRWQICRWPDRSELWIHSRWSASPFERSESLEDLVRGVWTLFQDLKYALSHSSAGLHFANTFFFPKVSRSHLDRFGQGVEAVLQAMEGGSLQKVVLAHNLEVQAPKPFHLHQSLHNLRHHYPDCYLFCWGNAQGTTFIGASPERLLRLTQGHLQTEALAGSAPSGTTLQDSHRLAAGLLSNPKERHEHQLVVDFIVAQLQLLGLSPQRSLRPQVRQLSHIQHLHTDIAAMLPPDLHPLEVLRHLHPTPAVAGVPRHLACDYIRQYERYDRSLYAAPLGWIDGSGNCEFVVGIRSALLQQDRARLMAGAGIVQGSIPQREIAEVELKLQTMLRSLA